MSADLSWRKHYDFISSCVYKTLGLLHRTFNTTNSVMLKSSSIVSIPGMLTTLLLLHHLGVPPTQGYPHAGEDPKMGILTHFILNYYSSDYKSRLVLLQMLPLMMLCELNDIIFFYQSNLKKMISLSSQSIIRGSIWKKQRSKC